MKLQHFEKTHVGLTREENQDSVKVIPEFGVFLVADGMGGEKAGAEASAQVVASVTRVVTEFFESGKATSPEAVGQMVVRALEEANNDVNAAAEKDPSKSGMGSTGTLLCLYRGLYFIAQVGDSRAYLVRNSNVRQITRDHSIVWELYESGIIKREQLETHPERHLLTQCIGSNRPIEVDLFSDKVRPGDLFLLCSDGLHGYAGEREMIPRLIDPIYTIEERTFRLLQSALSGGGGDNVSIMLVKVDELEGTDNWEPERGVHPYREIGHGLHQTMSLIQPLTGTMKTILPRRGGAGRLVAFAAIFLLLAAAALFGVAFLKFKGFCATLDVRNVDDLGAVEVRAMGAGSKEISRLKIRRTADRIEVCFKRRQDVLITIDAPGILPYTWEINPDNLTEAPLVIFPRKAGVLTFELPEGTEIKQIKIVNQSIGQPVYEYARSGRSRPADSIDLEPGQPHMVNVIDSDDNVFSQLVEVPEGHEVSLQVKF